MSETRDNIIASIINNPENAADAAIQLQKEFTKLQRALINIRDYDPGHCHGDVGCQMSDTLEFNTDTIEEVKDLL
jgi:hypothetical protein